MFCPNCFSINIEAAGFNIYTEYKCLDCGFQSPIFPEIEEDKIEELKEMKRKKKTNSQE